MRIAESGRFAHLAGSRAARRYAEHNLVSVHGRVARLRAIARGTQLRATERALHEADEAIRLACAHPATRHADWLLLRDYDGNGRGRSVLFFFLDDGMRPSVVIKMRHVAGRGESLVREAEVLRGLTHVPMLPRVHDYGVHSDHEMLVLSGLPGRPLSLLMQRSLRPRAAHAPHLASAGAWLGLLHSETRNGEAVAVHGDFWPRNILFSGTDVSGVVDWEHGAARGAPWKDLFTLPLLFATAAPAWRTRDVCGSFRAGFLEEGSVAVAVRGYFDAYASVTGVTVPALREPFETYLHDHERKEETGWATRYPWAAMRAAMRAASRSVFSG